MKLQVSFDMLDLNKAIDIASKIEGFVDILEIGAPLIYKNGIKAIEKFKNTFPKKEIFADVKMVDRVESIIKIFSNAGTNYISILAGTNNSTIQNASKIAHSFNTKLALDLVDAYSMGQSCMDAQALDIDLIIFHDPHETTQITNLLEKWENVRGNTKLPIFVAGKINKKNIDQVIALKPQGIIIGQAITQAENPIEEAEYFKTLINK